MPEEHVQKAVSDGRAEIKMVMLPCTGRTDVLYLLRAIEEGADMAMIVGCPEGQCRYLQGNLRAKQRVVYANRVLAEAGLGHERVRMINLDPAQDEQFAAALEDVIAKAAELGAWLRK